jgi:hypothetical protein
MNVSRFKQLLESTMGNVKPLLVEQKTPPTITEGQKLSLTCRNFTIFKDNNNKPKIKISNDEIITGDLLTDSEVIQASEFQDLGHKIGEPWGSGFKETYDEDIYGLKFYLQTGTPDFGVAAPESEEYDKTFILKPINESLRNSLGIIGSDDNVIFEVSMDQDKSFCKITSNEPNKEFLTTLTNDWKLNKTPFI